METTPTIFSIEIIPIPIEPDFKFEKRIFMEDPHDAQNGYPYIAVMTREPWLNLFKKHSVHFIVHCTHDNTKAAQGPDVFSNLLSKYVTTVSIVCMIAMTREENAIVPRWYRSVRQNEVQSVQNVDMHLKTDPGCIVRLM